MDLDDLKRETEERAASGSPIALLESAVTVSRRVSALGDELIDAYVEAARAAGCSWAQIGDALGVSRQAAQQRQKGWLSRLAGAFSGSGMFARFSPDARAVVTEAGRLAAERRHDNIGTEHLLWALAARPGPVAAEALAGLGISREMVEAALEAPMAPGTASGRGHIPFTPDAKQTLERTLREALALDHRYLGAEHVLIALTEVGTAGEALGRLGVTHERASAAVIATLADAD